ncbi:MAG TPA: DUF5131 family protein, partial [Gammaproteobacteria bacterium]|nr:DUF5131 family protein [Gammaproteobacteria bacterium]
HTMQLLTKRPERMRSYLSNPLTKGRIFVAAMDMCYPDLKVYTEDERAGCQNALRRGRWWPLPNVWIGVSVEDQASADERIPLLLDTPAAVRFVSAEPLLGPVDLQYASFNGADSLESMDGLDWVVVGGESGPKARPFNTDWALSIVEQCRAAGVPCFVKQLGGHVIQGGERRIKKNKKGADMSEWPHELRVREYP